MCERQIHLAVVSTLTVVWEQQTVGYIRPVYMSSDGVTTGMCKLHLLKKGVQ